ncbi:histidine phosphatase family protein [Dermatobacter hominis]|uniref:histidine phosphatase family protein n=1 Tax=Dermatobacter hominis TaxID=2884263 RepID=UPI001D0FF9B2|nr:histidine phosphatase family protein [Dermatobacter hominis]UDY34488.1 phosphoglycerate mutase family protein [Dermatobacter hominis]
MTILRYVTHAEVEVDLSVPVARWGLSSTGRARVVAMLDQPWVPGVGRIVSSDETKAVETARILADHLGLSVEVRPGTGENDRTATGFLPPDEFEATADRFFAAPRRSVRGWERAADAQGRIVAALQDLLDAPSHASTVVVGHGGVGTLWWCWLAHEPISRRHDQPGQGHRFTVDVDRRAVLDRWRPIDEIDDAG